MACPLPVFAHYASILDRTNRQSPGSQSLCSPTKKERRPSRLESPPPLSNRWQVNQPFASWSPLKNPASPTAKEQRDPAPGEHLPFSHSQAADRIPLSPTRAVERLPLGSLMTVERMACSALAATERRQCSPSPSAMDHEVVDTRERSHVWPLGSLMSLERLPFSVSPATARRPSPAMDHDRVDRSERLHAWRSRSAERGRRHTSVERCWSDARDRSPCGGQSPPVGGRGQRSHVVSSGAANGRDLSPCEVKSHWESSLRSSPSPGLSSYCPSSPSKPSASPPPATPATGDRKSVV